MSLNPILENIRSLRETGVMAGQMERRALPDQIQQALEAVNASQGRANQLQQEALSQEDPAPPDYTLSGKQALIAAAITALFHGQDARAAQAFSQGAMDVHKRRIDAEHQKAMQNLEKKRQMKLLEAQMELQKAGNAGDKLQHLRQLQSGRMESVARRGDIELRGRQEMDQIQAQNQGRLDLEKSRGVNALSKIFGQSMVGGKSMVNREAALQALQAQLNDGAITSEEFLQLKPIVEQLSAGEQKDMSAANLNNTKAEDITATRAARIADLIASGKSKEARAEVDRSRVELVKAQESLYKIRADWFPKQAAAKIAADEKRAEAAYTAANASAARVYQAARNGGGGLSQNTVFTALKSLGTALDKSQAQIQGYDTQIQSLEQWRASLLALPSDQQLIRKDELASVNSALSAAKGNRAYAATMASRTQSRIQEISNLPVGAVAGGQQGKNNLSADKSKARSDWMKLKGQLSAEDRKRIKDEFRRRYNEEIE